MDFLHVAVLALVRGVFEFLPIGSAADLAEVPWLASWVAGGPAVEAAVYLGGLAAAAVYFWRDLWTMAVGLFRYFTGRRGAGGARLAFQLTVGTLPIAAAAVLIDRYLPGGMGGWGSVRVVGWATLGVGVLLLLADRVGMTIRRVEHVVLSDALVIGIAQAAALIPGAGRAAMTMAGGRILGFERVDAARFSILLSMPVLLGLALVRGVDVAALPEPAVNGGVVLAALFAFLAGLIGIAVLMAWLRRGTFTPFVLFRIVLGVLLLALGYGWDV